MKSARLLPKFDPTDAVAVISGQRKQRFALERELALIGFITWMHFPTRPDFVSMGQAVGAANFFLGLSPAKRARVVRENPLFSQELFARALIGFPLGDSFQLEFKSLYNEMVNISEIIEFFMICPAERRPSLLKALHFIEQGGFVSEDVQKREKSEYTRSAATLKKSWVSHVVAGPFIWTAESFDFEKLIRCSPDGTATISEAKKFLDTPDKIADFFAAAKFCQDRLISRLDPRSRSRFKFVKFPHNIASADVELPEFDKYQIAFLETYQAPKLINEVG
jgi:hypothetical protein